MVEPIVCEKCGHKGYPGETAIYLRLDKLTERIVCGCGHAFDIPYNRDQHILSSHEQFRLPSASNCSENEYIDFRVGQEVAVKFKKQFDVIGEVQLLISSSLPITAKELLVNEKEMKIITSIAPTHEIPTEPIKIRWVVYGLKAIESLPTWWIHFYSAISKAKKHIWKSALLDYAVAFEIFIETYLSQVLTSRYGGKMSNHLLKKNWQVESRVKELLELATDHRLTEDEEIYKPWHDYVKEPRNKLSHGTELLISEDDVEKAHHAMYKAVKWIENLTYSKDT